METARPSAVLQQAAAKLREMAAAATPGSWSAVNDGGLVAVQSMDWDSDESYCVHAVAIDFHPGDAVWVPALSPAIAEPLARQWLELDRVWQEVGGTPGPARNAVRMAVEYAERTAGVILASAGVRPAAGPVV